MDKVSWSVDLRTGTGKGAARKLRAAGKLPGNVYGKDFDNLTISVDEQDVKDLIRRGNWNHALINLAGEGLKGVDGKYFIVKEMQRHHVSGKPLTIDLHMIRLDRKITVDVPLVIHGADAVKAKDGLLDVLARSLAVQCLPTEIPSQIEADASVLEVGQSLQLKDIELPEGVETELPPDYPLCVAQAPRSMDLPEPGEAVEGEEGEAAEGEAAEGAEGEGDKGDGGEEAKEE